MHLSIHNIISSQNERYCVSRHVFNANTINNCMQISHFLEKIKSLPNEIKICRISTSNISCGSGELVSSVVVTTVLAYLLMQV